MNDEEWERIAELGTEASSDREWFEMVTAELREELDLFAEYLAEETEKFVRAREKLKTELDQLRGGVDDLRGRIIQGADELQRMAREAATPETAVRLAAKAEGMRVVLDYLRMLDDGDN